MALHFICNCNSVGSSTQRSGQGLYGDFVCLFEAFLGTGDCKVPTHDSSRVRFPRPGQTAQQVQLRLPTIQSNKEEETKSII